MDIYAQRSELEQFLCDVRDHFRASLETSEYENTSNMFHMTAAEMTARLLLRCEQLLKQCSAVRNVDAAPTNGMSPGECTNSRYASQTTGKSLTTTEATALAKAPAGSGAGEDAVYLDMSAKSKRKSGSREYMMELSHSTNSDKTFRCSTRTAEHRYSSAKEGEDDDDDNEQSGDERRNATAPDHDVSDDERQIYDICQVSQQDPDETQRAFAPDLDLGHSATNCPYVDLPAGHLIIQQSSKYGQLQRIEKRLFFDQSKKCYCGILNDWLLCYADGPTASRPSIMLHLKSNGIEIEHSGEGKRREVCFQITTAADVTKKYVFQATNEVDAKEWIHAIEAAIRGDTAAIMKNARKLPTPPVLKKLTFVGGMAGRGANSQHGDYEEPFYNVPEPNELLMSKAAATKLHEERERPPELPDKANNNHVDLAKQFEYDVPKCPPQPLQSSACPAPDPLTCASPGAGQTESETAGLLNTSSSNGSPKVTAAHLKAAAARSAEKNDFQTKVKDVHSKLTSQLTAGGTPPERLKKAAKKTYSGSSTDSEALSLTTPTVPPPTAKELKKQKKYNTPTASPQKPNSNVTANSNNCSPNSSISEKSSKNWFLNRLNKTTSSARSSALLTPPKCKQSEKENLLNSIDMCDGYDNTSSNGGGGQSSNPASPILKSAGGGDGGGSAAIVGGKSKVNMIINQFESSGHHLSMFSMEALAGNAVASFNSFCASDCNNYEPIMTVSTPPSSFMKKV